MARKLKVLMAGPDPCARGGVATVARNYLSSKLVDLCDVRYLVTMREGSKASKLETALASYREFARIVEGFDVVHLHASKGASLVRKHQLAKCAHKHGVPYVIHLHSGKFAQEFEASGAAKQRAVKRFFDQAACVIALSEEWKTYLAKHVCAAETVFVLHNAVPIPQCCSQAHNHAVLFMGRLDDNKSPDVLIRAVAAAASKVPDISAVLAGDGDSQPYRKLASDLGIADRVEFCGWVAEGKEDLFSRCSAFCLPSKAEGMPMSLLEAMAHGLAAVATPVGGVSRVIDDGRNGFLFPVGDVDALARILGKLFSDANEARAVSRAARTTVKQRFGMDAHVQALMGVYRRACASVGVGAKEGCR